jgi:hypothetical protein
MSKVSKREKKSTGIKFCVKLKNTATGRFEMLRRAGSKECYLEQVGSMA